MITSKKGKEGGTRIEERRRERKTNKCLFLIFLEAVNSKIKVPANSFLGVGSLPSCRQLPSCCVVIWPLLTACVWRESETSVALFL